MANHNHCHAITVQYFEVLRHYAIEQQLTHVQECLFVPLLMTAFDIPKIMRWRDILRATLLLPPRTADPLGVHPLVRGLEAAERLFLNYDGSDLPATTYAAEPIIDFSGDLTITFRLNRPLDDDDNADDPKRQEEEIKQADDLSARPAGRPGGPSSPVDRRRPMRSISPIRRSGTSRRFSTSASRPGWPKRSSTSCNSPR